MTFELGRAQFIIDFAAEDALKVQSAVYNEVTKTARQVTKELAKQLDVRKSDVKNAASVLIAEEKRIAAETAKIQKQAAEERKRQAIEAAKREAAIRKEQERARKERAASIIREEKLIERERTNALKRQQREEQIIRKRNEQEREEADRREARREAERKKAGFFGRGGIAGTGVTNIGGTAATVLGFGAIASTALIVNKSIEGITNSIIKQEQATRALNAAFGETSAIYKKVTNEAAQAFNLVDSEVEQATARFGVLHSQTNLTGKQIENLSKLAIDNAAAFGGPLEEAHRAAAGMVLGETEAYEKYGVVLQEQVLKASAKLTEDERRRFTTMSESEKQLIRYRIAMEEGAKVQGAAAEKAKGLAGSINLVSREGDLLAKNLSTGLGREIEGGILLFAGLAKGANLTAEAFRYLGKAIKDTDSINPFTIGNRLKEIGEEERAFAAEQERIARVRQDKIDEEKRENDARDRREAELKQGQKILEEQLKRASEQRIKEIEDQIKAEEFARQQKLDALEESHEVEMRQLQDRENERKRASELELARIEKEKAERIKAAEELRDKELERIDAELDAVKEVTEERIRQLEVEKEQRTRRNEVTRDQELERLELEKEARDRVREKEDRETSDEITRKERLLDDNHRKALRRIEREEEKLREKDEDEEERKEKLEKDEDDRHRKRLRQLEKETDERIAALDLEIDRIEEAKRLRDASRRSASLQNNLSDAQLALRQATGTQDPAAREAAQQKLIGAIRIGNPEAIKKAQAELVEIVGQGQQAIAEAQRDLEDVQQDIRDNDLDETERLQVRKLNAEKDRIQKERQEEERQEDDRNRRRKERLDKDKNSEKERLDDALKKLERRREKEEDTHRAAKQELDDLVKYSARKLEDRRKAEDTTYERSVEAARKRYDEEQKAIEDTYDDKEKGLIPTVRRALEETETSYDQQRTAVNKRYKEEQEAIKLTYDHPETGLIAQHRRIERDAEIAYGKVVETTRNKYEEVRQAVERAYVAGDGKSGIIDKLNVLKEETSTKLRDVLQSFQDAKDGLVGDKGIIKLQWEEALIQAGRYFDYIKEQHRLEEARAERKRNEARPRGIEVRPGTGDPSVIPELPIYGPPIPRGIGTSPNPPTHTGSSGSPDPSTGAVGIAPDEVDDAFTVSFGYARPYSGNYTPGPGWEGRAAWPGGPSHHKGVDLILPGPNNGRGKFVPAFYPGVVKRTAGDTSGPGGKMVIIEDAQGRTHWYLHLDEYAVTAGRHVNRGDFIGKLGGTGTEEFPHLHYEVRAGDNDGPMSLAALRRDGIDPMSYVRGRDKGYRFNNPTMYMDMRTGEKGVLAERGPELLLGREQTRALELAGSRSRPSMWAFDYTNPSYIGDTNNNSVENTRNTVINITGVGMKEVVNEVKKHLRREELLYGRK